MVLQLGSSLYTQELISHSNLVRLVGTKLPSSLSSTPIGDIEGKVSCAEFAKLFRSAGGITWASTCNFSQKLREVIDKLLLDDTTKFARAEAQWEDVLHEWTQELFKKLMVEKSETSSRNAQKCSVLDVADRRQLEFSNEALHFPDPVQPSKHYKPDITYGISTIGFLGQKSGLSFWRGKLPSAFPYRDETTSAGSHMMFPFLIHELKTPAGSYREAYNQVLRAMVNCLNANLITLPHDFGDPEQDLAARTAFGLITQGTHWGLFVLYIAQKADHTDVPAHSRHHHFNADAPDFEYNSGRYIRVFRKVAGGVFDDTSSTWNSQYFVFVMQQLYGYIEARFLPAMTALIIEKVGKDVLNTRPEAPDTSSSQQETFTTNEDGQVFRLPEGEMEYSFDFEGPASLKSRRVIRAPQTRKQSLVGTAYLDEIEDIETSFRGLEIEPRRNLKRARISPDFEIGTTFTQLPDESQNKVKKVEDDNWGSDIFSSLLESLEELCQGGTKTLSKESPYSAADSNISKEDLDITKILSSILEGPLESCSNSSEIMIGDDSQDCNRETESSGDEILNFDQMAEDSTGSQPSFKDTEQALASEGTVDSEIAQETDLESEYGSESDYDSDSEGSVFSDPRGTPSTAPTTAANTPEEVGTTSMIYPDMKPATSFSERLKQANIPFVKKGKIGCQAFKVSNTGPTELKDSSTSITGIKREPELDLDRSEILRDQDEVEPSPKDHRGSGQVQALRNANITVIPGVEGNRRQKPTWRSACLGLLDGSNKKRLSETASLKLDSAADSENGQMPDTASNYSMTADIQSQSLRLEASSSRANLDRSNLSSNPGSGSGATDDASLAYKPEISQVLKDTIDMLFPISQQQETPQSAATRVLGPISTPKAVKRSFDFDNHPDSGEASKTLISSRIPNPLGQIPSPVTKPVESAPQEAASEASNFKGRASLSPSVQNVAAPCSKKESIPTLNPTSNSAPPSITDPILLPCLDITQSSIDIFHTESDLFIDILNIFRDHWPDQPYQLINHLRTSLLTTIAIYDDPHANYASEWAQRYIRQVVTRFRRRRAFQPTIDLCLVLWELRILDRKEISSFENTHRYKVLSVDDAAGGEEAVRVVWYPSWEPAQNLPAGLADEFSETKQKLWVSEKQHLAFKWDR